MICYKGNVTVTTRNSKQICHNNGSNLLFDLLCRGLAKQNIYAEECPTYAYIVSRDVYEAMSQGSAPLNINLVNNSEIRNYVYSTRIYMHGTHNSSNITTVFSGVLTNNHYIKPYSGEDNVYLALTDGVDNLLACCSTNISWSDLESNYQANIDWTISFINVTSQEST